MSFGQNLHKPFPTSSSWEQDHAVLIAELRAVEAERDAALFELSKISQTSNHVGRALESDDSEVELATESSSYAGEPATWTTRLFVNTCSVLSSQCISTLIKSLQAWTTRTKQSITGRHQSDISRSGLLSPFLLSSIHELPILTHLSSKYLSV